MYDYLIVGAGLFGSVFARQLKDAGKTVLVIDKRSHIGGNVYTEKIEGINVHKYGSHIFHTNSKRVWDYINQFAAFNRFTNSPIANYNGEIYSLPFNMYTFNKMWGCITPKEAKAIIDDQVKKAGIITPNNLEEQAISLVGVDIYEKLIKGYTQKQWGRLCSELPAFIIKRLPVRFSYDNNYFDALYQGIPMGGYTQMINALIDGIDIDIDTDYLHNRRKYEGITKKLIYTGAIDEYYDYSLGHLEYRSLRFETEVINSANYQGNAVVNFTDINTPYTRIIEHKWFEFGKDERGNQIPNTVITKEYSKEWTIGDEPYYPVNNEKNNNLYLQYCELSSKDNNVIFGGRLGKYKYYDMDKIVEEALLLVDNELSKQ